MTAVRMESLEIDDIDKRRHVVIDLHESLTLDLGEVDWICGHCEEPLLVHANEYPTENIIFRCPHCHQFSRYAARH